MATPESAITPGSLELLRRQERIRSKFLVEGAAATGSMETVVAVEQAMRVSEALALISAQRQTRLNGDAMIAREIGDSADYDLFES